VPIANITNCTTRYTITLHYYTALLTEIALQGMTHARGTVAHAGATVAADHVIAVTVTAAGGSVETVERGAVIEVILLLLVVLLVVAVYWTILASYTNRCVHVYTTQHCALLLSCECSM
jgi:hypothetical protein